MAKRLLDYDVLTGEAIYTEADDTTGRMVVETVQDVAPVLDHVKEKRNSGSGDNVIGGCVHHVAEIPNVVGLEMLKKGINVWNIKGKAEETRLLREIETNYPHLKVTNKTIWRPT